MASKKSKILAMALCASVMAGIYANPVMAGTITGIPGLASGNDEIVINGVTLKNHGTVEAAQGHFANAITLKNGWLNVGEGKFYVNATDGNTEIEGTLKVTGNTTLGALTANGLADLKGGLKVTGDANLEKLNVNGKFTVDATSGVVADNLTVDNDARVQGNLTVDNELTAGATNVTSLTATGVADLQGGLKVTGDTTLQKLSAGATTVGSLETTSGKFIVNTDGYTVIDNQLDVTGLANVGELTATKAGVTGDLQVFGQTTLNGLTVTNGTETGTLKVTGDTELAGLTAGNTTVNGTLNAGATTVDSLKSNGNAEVGGTLDVTGKATLKGGLAVTGGTETDTLNVTGAATVDSLKVVKDAELDGNLTVKGELSAANNKFGVDGDGNIRTTGSANIGGSTTIGGLLTVTDNANITGNATVGGGLGVTGNATVGGGLGVTGNATVGGTLNVTDLSTLGGGLTVSGQTKLNNDLTVNGSAEIDGNLKIGSGNFTVDAANGNTVVKGSLNLGSLDNREVGDAIKDLEAYADELKGAALPDKVGGIERDPAGAGVPGDGTTTIENGAEFTETAMTMGDTSVKSGVITVGAADNQTIIEGGAITADSLTLGSLGDREVGEVVNALEQKTVGIKRDDVTGTTTIEGATSFDANGMSIKDEYGLETRLDAAGISISNGEYSTQLTSGGAIFAGAGITKIDGGRIETASLNVGGIEFEAWHDEVNGRLDVLEVKTQNIKPGTGAGTGTGEGGTAAGESNNIIEVPATGDGHTGINGNVTVGGDITAGTGDIGGIGMAGGTINTGDTTIDGEGIDTGSGEFTGNVTVGGDINASTGNIGGIDMAGGTINTGNTTIDGDGITADTGDIGGIGMAGGTITTGDTTIDGNGMTVGKGTDITDIKDGNITVKGDEGKVEIGKGDVAIFDENGEKVTSIQHNYDEINRVEEKFDGEVNRLDNRITKVEDRIDKVGAMSAAIANLRTMGYDPAAPTEIAVGVGQYRSETGVALGMFHYPNKDFMLSLSVSTSGDEVMGGIGATWKFGRKSPEKVLAAEKEKAAKAKLAKAEAMKKAAKEAKIKAQQERHAKLAAERAAQAEAAK